MAPRPARLLGLTAGLVLAATAATADVTPQTKWQLVQGPHFRVMGDAGERALRQAAERMEQLHELLVALHIQDEDRASDTTLLVFRDRNGYRPFQPRYNGQPLDVAGYFVSGPMNYITLLAGQEASLQRVVFHEYVHLVIHRAVRATTPWIDEGLAEFYSTFDTADGGRVARLGSTLDHHLLTLQRGMLPLRALAVVDHDSPYYNEQSRSSIFYAESWALIHYLQVGKQRKYARAFVPFIDAVSSGMPFAEACTTHLGLTVDALEQELRNYVQSVVMYRLEVPLSERLTRIERLTATRVSESDAHATLGDLLLRLGRADEAAEHLEHALSTDGANPLALGALALRAADANQGARARDLARRAAASATYLSEYYRALALETLADALLDADATADAPLIESTLRSAVALNPGFAPAHAALARRLATTVSGRDEALRLAARALALAPLREEYAVELARVHLLKGDTRTARSILGPLMATGSTPDVKNAARQYMGWAARLELSATAPEPSSPVGGRATDPAPTGPSPPPGLQLDLRPVGSGETRVFGTMGAIECGADGIAITVALPTGAVRVRAAAFAQVAFTAFRQDLGRDVTCGPQPPTPVLLTYRASADEATPGTAVAVEFLPDGYRPPPG